MLRYSRPASYITIGGGTCPGVRRSPEATADRFGFANHVIRKLDEAVDSTVTPANSAGGKLSKPELRDLSPAAEPMGVFVSAPASAQDAARDLEPGQILEDGDEAPMVVQNSIRAPAARQTRAA